MQGRKKHVNKIELDGNLCCFALSQVKKVSPVSCFKSLQISEYKSAYTVGKVELVSMALLPSIISFEPLFLG